ncbi:Hgd [Symbiodinium sp. CCMP2456]|nr:Hgd [Symbiodinium sp. CCMP2456]
MIRSRLAAAKRIGFVGLGSMGSGMAANLVAKLAAGKPEGQALLFDRSGVAVQRVVAEAAAVAEAAVDLPQLAAKCDIVFLCLPEGGVVLDAVRTMSPTLREGALVVDSSTTSPAVAQKAAQQLGQRGVGFLDAPVTGAPARAAAGTLTSMVGGSEKHLEAARPFLGTFATKILHMGEVGNGQLAKALNNCLYNVSCAAMAEMLPFALRAGLPMPAFVDAVTSGTGQSFGFNQWASLVLQREFEAPKHGFPMGAAFKDLETLVAAASAEGLPVPPVVAATLATYQRALAMGLGEEHKGAMVKVWEAQLGVCCSGTEAEQKK